MVLRLTESGIVLKYFCHIEVGLRIFLSEEKREEKVDSGNFCPKKQKGERELDLKKFVKKKGEEK